MYNSIHPTADNKTTKFLPFNFEDSPILRKKFD